MPCPSCSGDVRQRRHYERFERLLEESQLPKGWRDWTFETFPQDADKREAVSDAASFARGQYRPHFVNCLISGPFGTGKTGLAVCILRAFLAKLRPALLWTAPDLLTRIKATYREDGEGEEALLRRLVEVDLLVLDDLGAERASDWQREKLYQVLNGRMASERETVFTSNGDADALRSVLGERILERIEFRCMPIDLTGRNLRRPLAMGQGGQR